MDIASLDPEELLEIFIEAVMEVLDEEEPGQCFVAGTPVHTPKGLRAIEGLDAGEEIWALDPITLKWTIGKVAQRFSHQYRGELTEITVNGRKLTATGHHPFWVVSGSELASRASPRHCEAKEAVATPTLTGRWVEARDLRPGDVIVVRTSDGFAKIEAIRT